MSVFALRRTITAPVRERLVIGNPRYLSGVVVLAVPALLIAWYSGLYWQTIIGLGAAYLVAALGYNLALGYGRQFVFCQAAFMATGAYSYAMLQARGWSVWLCALAAIVVSLIFALIIGMTTARLREGYLALVTLAFSQALLLGISLWSATGGDNGIAVSVGGYEAPLIGVIVMVIVLLGIDRVMRSRTGRSIIMVGADEQAAATMGVPVARARVGILALSALLGAGAGVVLSGTLSFISTANFTIQTTLLLLTIIVVGGLASIWGTVAGTILIVAVQQGLADSFAGQAAYIYAGILFVVLVVRPGGLSSAVRRRPRGADMGLLRRLSAEISALTSRVSGQIQKSAAAGGPGPASYSPPAVVAETPPVKPPAGRLSSTTTLLEISDVSVSFGGVRAVSHATLNLAEGEFLAIVGPNGAGKSTLLNAISGLVTLASGSVVMGGQPLHQMPPHKRPGLGVARTFQHSRLFDGLTAADQVLCGQFSARGYHLWDALARTSRFLRSENRAVDKAMELLTSLRLDTVAFSGSHELSGPEARLVGLARALISQPRLLLLDEIAAACTSDEKRHLCQLLTGFRQDRGLAAIVVEHDLNFVRMLADRVVFMADGQVLATGTPEEVFSRPDVLESYVGTARLEPKVD